MVWKSIKMMLSHRGNVIQSASNTKRQKASPCKKDKKTSDRNYYMLVQVSQCNVGTGSLGVYSESSVDDHCTGQ